MRHDLTPDIVAQLERQYEEDVARTRALYSRPWYRHPDMADFYGNQKPNRRSAGSIWIVLGLWLAACFGLAGIVRLFQAVGVVIAEALLNGLGL